MAVMPERMTIMATKISGVDLSYCQSGINYSKLAEEGVKFALIRVGFTGTSSKKQYADSLFETHVKGCSNAGIDIGYYWYSCAKTPTEAEAEAVFCAKLIDKFSKPAYPVFFDAEELSMVSTKKNTTDTALAFINKMEKLGYPSGLYTNHNWLTCYFDKKRILGKVDIWLAYYFKKLDVDYNPTIWQPGVRYSSGMKVDYDWCYVDYPKKTKEFYERIQNGGNITNTTKPSASKKTPLRLAKEVLEGKWGNGSERKKRLTNAGYDYSAVQKEVNKLLKSQKKSNAEIAKEVIAGKWGNGSERKKRLANAGYDYSAVQKEVDKLLMQLP